MKKVLLPVIWLILFSIIFPEAYSQKKIIKKGAKYDTIIVEKGSKPVKKPLAKPVVKKELVLPSPELINQPYYYNKDDNHLVKLENSSAQMVTKKKGLGLKGAEQFLSIESPASMIRFTAKKEIVFFIKTSGDVIDLTSYIKLYKFIPSTGKREVTVSSKEGVFSDKNTEKGRLIDFGVKQVLKDTYMIQFSASLEAGEYGFVWLKNMDLKEYNVFAFGIDWKSSD
ncbi:MAG: hypothetical protein ACXWV0_04075 [Flavisolibacter sp.]